MVYNRRPYKKKTFYLPLKGATLMNRFERWLDPVPMRILLRELVLTSLYRIVRFSKCSFIPIEHELKPTFFIRIRHRLITGRG